MIGCKSQIHARSELILLCFSTLKLKHFAYLFLQPSVYDYVYDEKYHISVPFGRSVRCILDDGRGERCKKK